MWALRYLNELTCLISWTCSLTASSCSHPLQLCGCSSLETENGWVIAKLYDKLIRMEANMLFLCRINNYGELTKPGELPWAACWYCITGSIFCLIEKQCYIGTISQFPSSQWDIHPWEYCQLAWIVFLLICEYFFFLSNRHQIVGQWHGKQTPF